jgi:flagellar L-ring protein precursor FlgH
MRSLLLLTLLILTGCVIEPPPEPEESEWRMPTTPREPYVTLSAGSLYQDGAGVRLYDDRKAWRVGDIITVRLEEETSSSKQANTSIDKSSSVSMGPGNVLFGSPVTKNGIDLMETNIGQDREFSGNSTSDQRNRIDGAIAVHVVEVMPNGYLVIKGEKWLTLNQGQEVVRFSGVVRPDDIDTGNEISSIRVANARVIYTGKGALAEANTMGWFERFFNSEYWPF